MKNYLASDLDIECIFKHTKFLNKENKLIAEEIVKLFKANSSYKLHDIIREISTSSNSLPVCNVLKNITLLLFWS